MQEDYQGEAAIRTAGDKEGDAVGNVQGNLFFFLKRASYRIENF